MSRIAMKLQHPGSPPSRGQAGEGVRFGPYLRAGATRLASSDTPQLDARVIAKKALGLDDAGLIASADRPLSDTEIAAFDALIARRAAGEPIAYIVGEKEFFGLTFKMTPGVLIPRPDTETLVHAVIRRRDAKTSWRILDLGSGSGAILLALLKMLPKAAGVGVDVDPAAVALASDNARALDLAERARWVVGEWERAPEEEFDIIVSNPPYIEDGERDALAPDVRNYEDPRALFAGRDGLDAYRRILPATRTRIAAQGLIVLELGADRSPAVGDLARREFAGATPSFDRDLADRERALVIDLKGQKKD